MSSLFSVEDPEEITLHQYKTLMEKILSQLKERGVKIKLISSRHV